MEKNFKFQKKSFLLFVVVLSAVMLFSFGSGEASSGYTPDELSYVTITEGYDWGPAVSTIILHTNTLARSNSVSSDDFSVYVTRKDPSTSEVILSYVLVDGVWQVIESKGYRTITDLYVSDSRGKPKRKGRFITIKMSVHPADSLPSVLNYDFWTGSNVWINAEYEISGNINGQDIFLYEDDLEKNITLLMDDFDLSGNFVYEDETFGTIELGYASYTPEKHHKSKKWFHKRSHCKSPLIVWLHGGGEGGNDTRIPLVGNRVVNLASDDIQKVFGGAYVLVPQAPTFWMDSGSGGYGDFDGTSKYTTALMVLIEEYVAANPDIDRNRIYVGGCSNGGFMSSRLTVDYPDYFAAAFPICGTVPDFNDHQSDENIEKIKDIPMWFTHSEADTTVDPEMYTNSLYQKLIDAGAKNVHYSHPEKVVDTSGLYFQTDDITPYEYFGHWSWIYVLNNDPVLVDYDGVPVQIHGMDVTIMEWMSAQRKNTDCGNRFKKHK